MLLEYRKRITKKREIIEQNKRLCKELQLAETMVICERCKQDLAPLRTLEFVSDELHFAKCVFGSFKPVDIPSALQLQDENDRGFVDLYI